MKKILTIIILCIVHCALCIDVVAQTRRDGEFLFNEKRYEEAYDVYVKLMNRYPKDYLLKYQAGRCLYELQRYDEALALFEVAAANDVVKANMYLGVIYFYEYRFEESAAAYSIYIESLDEGKETLLNIYQSKLEKSQLGARMIERIEDIAIVDSVKVHKQQFLSAYRLPRDLGKLEVLRGKLTALPQVTYYTGRGDKKLFAEVGQNGQSDLSVAYRLVDGWSEAANLSSVLNTPEDENFPFELPDGVTLYFASKGHNSLGGYDIFLTRYNSTINDYSDPVNIGMPFNSPVNDYMYVFDEMSHIGWFATDRFQHPDTVVVYEFVPNHKKVLIETSDADYRRRAAKMQVYRKADIKDINNVDDEEVEQQGTEINFFVNDGIVYTRKAQFKSEEARTFYKKVEETEGRLKTLMILLEGKRREFFFSRVEEDQNILRAEILELEKEVRKYKNLVDEYILQTRKAELSTLNSQLSTL